MLDPNFFGGEIRVTDRASPVKRAPQWTHPFSVTNQLHPEGNVANYRTAGLADIALAIVEDRPHRCSLDVALHAIEIMTGMLASGGTGRLMDMQAANAPRRWMPMALAAF